MNSGETVGPGTPAAERTVLLVGGAGYVGSVITRHLLECGYGVRSFDLLLFNNRSTVTPFLDDPRYEFVHGDLADQTCMGKALDGVTDVVLLAGLVGDPITRKYPDAARRINVDGYDKLLDLLAGRGLGRVVFASTCSNYGFIEGDHLAEESHPLEPLSSYAAAKVAVEKTILGLQGQIDYAPVVLRFATAFGLSPRMRFDLTVNEFTRDLVLGNELVVYDTKTWRPYCHVADFAEITQRVLEAPIGDVAFEVFNAGSEANNFTKQMIVDAILKQMPEARVSYKNHGADARNYRVSFAKIRQRLDFEPRHTVESGIREIIDAMNDGLYHDIAEPRGFYGNHEIDY